MNKNHYPDLALFLCLDCNQFHVLTQFGTQRDWNQLVFDLGHASHEAGIGDVVHDKLDPNIVNKIDESISHLVH